MARKPKEATIQSANRADAAALLKEAGLPIIQIERRARRVIPIGVSGFDHGILGTGGILGGILTQIWGPEKSGKTTLAYRLIAQAQRLFPDEFVVYLDSEFAFDEDRAIAAGIDLTRLQLVQDNIAETVYSKLLKYVASGACSLVILDTLANLISKEQSTNLDSKEEGGKRMPGQTARITKEFARDFVRYIHQKDVAAVMLNQVTMKIGVLYGDPTDFPGGENYRHNIQMDLRLRNVEFITEGPQKETVGIRIAVNVRKNKKAAERKTDESSHLTLYFKDGIERSKVDSLLDDAIRTGFIVAGGAGRFKMVDLAGETLNKWHGRDNVRKALAEDGELADQLSKLVYGSGGSVPPTVIDESEMSELPD